MTYAILIVVAVIVVAGLTMLANEEDTFETKF